MTSSNLSGAQDSGFIVDYAERHKYGERVSAGFVELAVNRVLAKRLGCSTRSGKTVFDSSIPAFSHYRYNRCRWPPSPTAPHFLMLSWLLQNERVHRSWTVDWRHPKTCSRQRFCRLKCASNGLGIRDQDCCNSRSLLIELTGGRTYANAPAPLHSQSERCRDGALEDCSISLTTP